MEKHNKMFKATEDGIIEFGEVLKLTKADRLVISRIIINSSYCPTAQKIDGKWVQMETVEVFNNGFRVFDPLTNKG